MQVPTAEGVLGVLPKARLVALGRDLDIAITAKATKEQQLKVLLASGQLRFRALLEQLGRDELKAACRALGLDDSGRYRRELQQRLLAARGELESAPPTPLFSGQEVARLMPRRGDIVLCRHREWLVDDVAPRGEADTATRVRLICLDDDNQGHTTEVLWELELGAKVHRPEAHGLGAIQRIDPPRHFAAYLHALKWSSVTATDGRLFQSPFRAGIQLHDYQLTPLLKALQLPRANLFIADDVGLGKTIEAGLILSELSLRQRVDISLIVCPASVTLQWRDEMERKFGLRFEIMSRAFVAQRRKERGFGVNPWSTHPRFIVSHQLLRRPEYRDPLLAQLGERAQKSLLILDEAHVVAPASPGKYAVDSRLTKVLRDIAPRFDNRLFLSATPHNGHSNSFSALLELLDPQRFTRGVPIESAKALEPVMVRRLKQDLRDAGIEEFPVRRILQLGLSHDGKRWHLSERAWDPQKKGYSDLPPRALGEAPAFELELARELAEYTALAAPEKGRGRLAFVTLQKRLLSSVEAFARTLEVHSTSLTAKRAGVALEDNGAHRQLGLLHDDDTYGPDDELLEEAEAACVANHSALVPAPAASARKLLERMLQSAHKYRHQPDAKVRALVDWIARHQCPGASIRGRGSDRPAGKGKAQAAWAERRLIIFTEYGDSKRYLVQQLSAAIAGTEQAEERILQLHGGMGDEQRAEVQRAFNGKPSEHPVRILVATDAAREGINLQAFCADLFHFDVPWNPARLEQRNGRIDRTLQPSPTVRCGYFSYAQRGEDPVLATLVEKTEVITRELGSLGAVVMEDLEESGIRAATGKKLDALTQRAPNPIATRELEGTRKLLARLKAEVEDAGEVLNHSKKTLEFDPVLLRDALNVGFELAGASALEEEKGEGAARFRLPELPESWSQTLDALRPARGRDEPFWQWRQQPPQPVTFKPSEKLGDDSVHLHLAHPLVQRVLGRFLAQGFSANDLSRVTVVRNRRDALVRVIAFGRLSLFGRGAARLHDQLISVAARWFEGRPDALKPFAEEGDRKAIELLEEILAESPGLDGLGKGVLERVQAAAPDLFKQLWTPIRQEADASATEVKAKLKARGRAESDALKEILERQREAIHKRLKGNLKLEFGAAEAEEREQFEQDKKHMERRLGALAAELKSEPQKLEGLYDVTLCRLQPVGLIVLWPTTRGGNGGRS